MGGMDQFRGTLPEAYDRFLRPLLFEPYAAYVAGRLEVGPAMRVLELACGTGIVTRALLARLPGDATVVATDLSEGMLAVAQQNVAPGDPRLAWQQVDALAPPFDDASFDAVICQFALMFFGDRAGALRHMRRVLRRDGQLLVATWDALERNPAPRLAHETLLETFPEHPPRFFETAFGCHDAAALEALVIGAGFSRVQVERVTLEGTGASAADVASGLVLGSPVSVHLRERRLPADRATTAVERAIAAAYGPGEVRVPLSAVVISARA